jgi:hypothetical protein
VTIYHYPNGFASRKVLYVLCYYPRSATAETPRHGGKPRRPVRANPPSMTTPAHECVEVTGGPGAITIM